MTYEEQKQNETLQATNKALRKIIKKQRTLICKIAFHHRTIMKYLQDPKQNPN